MVRTISIPGCRTQSRTRTFMRLEKAGVAEMRNWSRRSVLLGTVGCLLAACSHGRAGHAAYSVGVSGEGNTVTIVQDSNGADGAYVARVQSTRGIGQANIGWWGEPAPHQLTFDMALSGLESFSLRWAEYTVLVSVNATDGSVWQRLNSDDEPDSDLLPSSPFWIEVALPIGEGHSFRLAAPVAFLADAPRLWAITWVDFYR